MLSGTAVDKVICWLVRGSPDEAVAYLKSFRAEERSPDSVRTALAARARPEFMPLFDAVAPWLVDGFPEPVGQDVAGMVRQALGEVGATGITTVRLTERLRRVPAEDIRAALPAMIESGEVTVERERTGGRPAERYRLATHSAEVRVNPFA